MMLRFATVLAAWSTASALQQEQQQLYQQLYQQQLLQQEPQQQWPEQEQQQVLQQQMLQLQQQQQLLLQQQQQLLSRHHRRPKTQPWGARPQTQPWGVQLQDQAPGQQPRRMKASLQLLQQEPAAQLAEPPVAAAQEQDAAPQPEPSQALPPQPEAAAEPMQPDPALPPQAEVAAEPQQPEVAAPRAPEPVGMYKLRLCNAYAWPEPLEMRRVEEPKLVEYPLPYKSCHDYSLPLRNGDQLQFRAGDVSIGTFSVRGLPEDPRNQLLLIPHRRDASSAAVTFDSHIYRGAGGSQVAVIDTYSGPEQSTLMIEEPTRQEELRFNSVVAVTPGSYKFALSPASQQDTVDASRMPAAAGVELSTRADENYVVLRVGMGAGKGEAFPEELVVFPGFSGGVRGGISALVLALLGCLALA